MQAQQSTFTSLVPSDEHINIIAFIRAVKVTGISAINMYRAYAPLTALGEHNRHFRVIVLDQNSLREIVGHDWGDNLLGHDIYVISRLFAGHVGRDEFLEAIREHGGVVVFDTDDDLTDDYRELGRGEDFKGILEGVDAVTVSTPYLAKRLADHSRFKPWVLPNHIDVKWFAQTSMEADRQSDKLTVGLVGTASHYDDWQYPAEALRRIAQKYDVEIVVAGYMPDYLEDLPNVLELKPVPYFFYPRLMRQFDIVCCSLDVEDGFNLSKSSVKALEAMAAARKLPNGKIGGAVAVCTDMAVYRRTVNHRSNGLLTHNDNWYDTLAQLIEDRPLHYRLAAKGHKWVRQHRNVVSGYRLWAQAYRDILRRSNGRE